MAVGNQTGKTFVWDIGVDDPTKARYNNPLANLNWVQICVPFRSSPVEF